MCLTPILRMGSIKLFFLISCSDLRKKNYTSLLRQLEGGAMHAEVTFHSEDKFGKRYTADITVKGMEGRCAVVRTGWIVTSESREAHLATLYVRKKI